MSDARGLRRLQDGGGRSAREVVDGLALREPLPDGGRPRVVAAMIASVDGRAAVEGRSGGLGHPADRELLRELRAGADAVLVGTRTLEIERYADLLDPEQRARRVALGLAEHPVVATVSRALRLPLDIPLFHEPGVPIVVFTESAAPAPEVGADLEVVRFAPGTLRLPAAVAALGERGVRGITCEGGPSLLRELVAQGALDDLLVTIAPLLVAGSAPTVLTGDVLAPPAEMALRDVHRAGDHVFLHYGAVR